MAGALLDPKGAAESIDESEHRALLKHLRILRTEGFDEHQSVLSAVLRDFEMTDLVEEHGLRRESLLSSILFGFNADCIIDVDSIGALIPLRGEKLDELDAAELTALQDALKVLRAGGWFSDWLEAQLHTAATSDSPKSRHPSPLTIMGSLTDSIDEYDRQMQAARELVAQRPDVLIPPAKVQELRQAQGVARKRPARAHSKRSKSHADAA